MSLQVRVHHPGGFNDPVGGGGKPPRKPGDEKPGRSHEEERPLVPLSKFAKKRARKRAGLARKAAEVAANSSRMELDSDNEPEQSDNESESSDNESEHSPEPEILRTK